MQLNLTCSLSVEEIQNGDQYSRVPILLTIFKMEANTHVFLLSDYIKNGCQYSYVHTLLTLLKMAASTKWRPILTCSYSVNISKNGGQYSRVPVLLMIFKMAANTHVFLLSDNIKKGCQNTRVHTL